MWEISWDWLHPQSNIGNYVIFLLFCYLRSWLVGLTPVIEYTASQDKQSWRLIVDHWCYWLLVLVTDMRISVQKDQYHTSTVITVKTVTPLPWQCITSSINNWTALTHKNGWQSYITRGLIGNSNLKQSPQCYCYFAYEPHTTQWM